MISSTSAYAIRAATFLAQQKAPVSASDIAQEVNVPIRYLQQILRGLVKIGILSSSRGVGGGFSLKQPAGDIALGRIVSLFDDVDCRTTCPFGDEGNCDALGACPIHEHWSKVVEPYKKMLKETTLSDLAKTCAQ
ncbi:MAG: Rrf2 family transcriptional regulator [Verrucomicrobiota bacterium]|nr:Rrf2 family transcriptional regulator [Verrucomicrobiota bacterium]HJN82698.1 Rrf2 family transcriptional regulator [Verrucomicrobiota bacterium]